MVSATNSISGCHLTLQFSSCQRSEGVCWNRLLGARAHFKLPTACVSHSGLAVAEHSPDRPPVLLPARTAGIAGLSRPISTQTALVRVFSYQVTSTTLEQVLVPASHTW
jgi:hypothetical protein